MSAAGLLVLVRHGQSSWNDQARFTGWADPPLSSGGLAEARAAAASLTRLAERPSLVVTSVLQRAVQTAEVLLEHETVRGARLYADWQLNERHYGALQGQTHQAAEARYGRVQVSAWRRGWEDQPPPMPATDPRHPSQQVAYRHVDAAVLPSGESLGQCRARVWPALLRHALPALRSGATVLHVGHGNELRALVATLEALRPGQVRDLVLPTATPRSYTFTEHGWTRQAPWPVTGTRSGP